MLFPYLQPPAAEAEKDQRDLQVGAQVRIMLWLGLEKDQDDWTKCCGTGEVAVFAETVSDLAIKWRFLFWLLCSGNKCVESRMFANDIVVVYDGDEVSLVPLD